MSLLSGTSRVVAGGSCPVPTPTPSFVLRLAVDGVADEIAVTSFGWGVSQGGASTTGGARPARLEVGDLNVTKHLDAASPALARHCAEGTRIPSATLRACSDETCAQPYLEFVMQDVLVSAYRPGGAAEGDDCLPVEQVGFNFTKIKADYKEQKQAVELQRSGRKWEVLPPLPDDGT